LKYIGHDWNLTEKIFLITFGISIENRSTSALDFRMHPQQRQGKIIMELCNLVPRAFPAPPTFKGKALGTRLGIMTSLYHGFCLFV